jgi:hypothetical protein
MSALFPNGTWLCVHCSQNRATDECYVCGHVCARLDNPHEGMIQCFECDRWVTNAINDTCIECLRNEEEEDEGYYCENCKEEFIGDHDCRT